MCMYTIFKNLYCMSTFICTDSNTHGILYTQWCTCIPFLCTLCWCITWWLELKYQHQKERQTLLPVGLTLAYSTNLFNRIKKIKLSKIVLQIPKLWMFWMYFSERLKVNLQASSQPCKVLWKQGSRIKDLLEAKENTQTISSDFVMETCQLMISVFYVWLAASPCRLATGIPTLWINWWNSRIRMYVGRDITLGKAATTTKVLFTNK